MKQEEEQAINLSRMSITGNPPLALSISQKEAIRVLRSSLEVETYLVCIIDLRIEHAMYTEREQGYLYYCANGS